MLALVVLANLVLAGMMYESIGWYFIRGYDEVGNFLVYCAVAAQVAANLVIAVVVGLVGFIMGWRHRGDLHRFVLAGLLISALTVLVSPLYAPVLGQVAKRSLWIDTPLREAALYQDADLVIILLENGASPRAQDLDGMTALHYMAAGGKQEAVKVLLEKGADPNARATTTLDTPLHWAVRFHHDLPTIRTLAEYGADPTLKDSDGKRPLDYAYVLPDREERIEVFNAFSKWGFGGSGGVLPEDAPYAQNEKPQGPASGL